jgi:integrase
MTRLDGKPLGRALSPDERQTLVDTASQRPEWETAYLAAIIALNTTMRGCELRRLQWMDVDFAGSALTIRKSKTTAGERVIPLTQDASDAFVRLALPYNYRLLDCSR